MVTTGCIKEKNKRLILYCQHCGGRGLFRYSGYAFRLELYCLNCGRGEKPRGVTSIDGRYTAFSLTKPGYRKFGRLRYLFSLF
jgi:hypothetical protein